MEQKLLQGLLQVLDKDPRAAGAAYRELHLRLARFFRINRTPDPEALADEALDRLARRIETAADEEIASPQAFALGIARHLLHEEGRRRQREDQTAALWTTLHPAHDPRHEQLIDAIEACMAQMRTDQRNLLHSYYQWQGRAKIDHHRQLAEEMGLTLNALRNRLMRTRKVLDQCVHLRCSDVFNLRRTFKREGRNF